MRRSFDKSTMDAAKLLEIFCYPWRQFATPAEKIRAVKEIFDSGQQIDVDMNITTFRNCLHHCCSDKEHSLELVAYLLSRGANPNSICEFGETPLLLSIYEPGKVWLLLQNGADINKHDWNGLTPLHKAARAGQFKTVLLLLRNGADCTINNNKGQTAEEYCFERFFEMSGDPEHPRHVFDGDGPTTLPHLQKCLDLLRGGGSGTKSARP